MKETPAILSNVMSDESPYEENESPYEESSAQLSQWRRSIATRHTSSGKVRVFSAVLTAEWR